MHEIWSNAANMDEFSEIYTALKFMREAGRLTRKTYFAFKKQLFAADNISIANRIYEKARDYKVW